MKQKGSVGEPTAEEAVRLRKLIDRVSSLERDGAVLGILATSYELQPDFVETDFLPALVGLGAWDERNWRSRIAMERSLAGMVGASLLQDARRYSTRPRSLRLEHRLAVGPRGQKLHAKIVLIVCERAVRLLVGSANLTEPGYRRNREVATELIARAEDGSQAALIRAALREARAVLEPWWTETAEAVVETALARLPEDAGDTRADSAVFLWSGGESATGSLLRRFVALWPPGRSVERISIVSPFWSEEAPQGPLSRLLLALRDRDALGADATIRLLAAAARDPEGNPIPIVPESLARMDLAALGASGTVEAVDPEVDPVELDVGAELGMQRDLHAKVVLLEGEGHALAYCGSANFTRRGWGLLSDPALANVEAGLAVQAAGNAARALATAILPETIGASVPIGPTSRGVIAKPTVEKGMDLWPSFVRDVRLAPSEARPEELELVIHVDASQVAGPWTATIPLDGEPVSLLGYDEGHVEQEQRRALSEAELRALMREQQVHLVWWACGDGVDLPVNVELAARDRLPIAADGKQPGEALLLAYYQGRIAWEELFPPPPDWQDPDDEVALWEHETTSVDTSRILSYQVREFVESLWGIRQDLRDAAASESSIRLALRGPVSPVALAAEIRRAVLVQGRSPTAGAFELMELHGLLTHARRWSIDERLRGTWARELGRAIDAIEQQLKAIRDRAPTELGPGSTFARYERAMLEAFANQRADG